MTPTEKASAVMLLLGTPVPVTIALCEVLGGVDWEMMDTHQHLSLRTEGVRHEWTFRGKPLIESVPGAGNTREWKRIGA